MIIFRSEHDVSNFRISGPIEHSAHPNEGATFQRQSPLRYPSKTTPQMIAKSSGQTLAAMRKGAASRRRPGMTPATMLGATVSGLQCRQATAVTDPQQVAATASRPEAAWLWPRRVRNRRYFFPLLIFPLFHFC